MKSIEARFKTFGDKHPMSGSYIVLVKAVKGQKFTRPALAKAFATLVPKEDYDREDKTRLLDFLEHSTNGPALK